MFAGSLLVRNGYDQDAQAYINAVETADGLPLEAEVKVAITRFVKGCKSDDIWNAIKASCIMAGARTLAGALVPLVGTAPNNFNFVGADYNRKTGLVGNGINKYLSSNRANNADPQNNNHNAVWLSTYTSGDQYLMGSGATSGHNFLLARSAAAFFRNRFKDTGESIAAAGNEFSGGTFGMSRTSANAVSVTYRQNAGQVFSSLSTTSNAPANSNINVFITSTSYSNCRLGFYSIGESLDLSKLDARIAALMSDFNNYIS